MGSKRALTVLRSQMIAYARAIAGSADEAEDLVQDALVRALSSADAPKGGDDLRFWMFGVIRNLHIDARRRARVRAEYFAQQERLLGNAPPEPADPLDGILVRQVFDALSADHREILFLVDIMGMRYAEAARILEVADGTVMSRVSRARKAMLERLEHSNVAPITRRRKGS